MSNLKLINPQFGKFKNACYANAVTQLLTAIPMLKEHFESRSYQVSSKSFPVSDEVFRLFSHQGQSTSTDLLRKAVGVASNKEYFSDGTQQDASEFLRELLSSLLQETSSTNQGFLSSLIRGKLTFQRGFLETNNGSCKTCQSFVNPKDEDFYILDYNNTN